MSEAKILKHDPLGDADPVPHRDLYGGGSERRSPGRPARALRTRPTHYKVVCISLYTRDIEALEATVAELKRRGYTRANKSQLIRYALSQLDIDRLPPPPP